MTGGAVEQVSAIWITRVAGAAIDLICWSLAAAPLGIGIVAAVWTGGFGVRALLLGLLLTLAAFTAALLSYRNGRSPGKLVMGIQVVRVEDGEPPSWGYNFLMREILVKGLVVGIIDGVTLGIFFVVNYLWPLWDKRRQALHDKMASTRVAQAR